MTINGKIVLIVATNLLMTLFVGGVGYYGISALSEDQSRMHRSGELLRNHMKADMMHDALRGGFYGALLAANGVQGAPTSGEVVEEMAVYAETINRSIAANKALATDPATRNQLERITPTLETYVLTAQELAAKAIKDPAAVGQAEADRFREAFGALETQLGSFGDEAFSEVLKLNEIAIAHAEEANRWMHILLLTSFGLSLTLSWYLASSIKRYLTSAIGQLSARSASTLKMNARLDNLAQSVAASATEQAAAVQESVASMAEMSSMIGQTVDGAAKSLEAANQATQRTEDGSRIMTEMVASMSSIQQANQQLREMAAIIKEISVKTGVINDIVFKTQLLAFNASIEAARAGQHGRGFAVVAEEVGNLADMSGNAAKEIQTLLDSSEKQVSNMVEITEQRVAQGLQVSEKAAAAFAQISRDIATISSQVQSINDAMREQESGVQQTQTAMTQIDTAAQQTSQASVGVSQSVTELKRQTDEVNQVIAGLRALVVGRGGEATASRSFTTEIVELDDAHTPPSAARPRRVRTSADSPSALH